LKDIKASYEVLRIVNSMDKSLFLFYNTSKLLIFMLEKLESTMYLILVYIEVVWRSKGILYI